MLIDVINYNVPCISTNCPRAKRILLDGNGGYLVTPKSPKLIANKMLFSINNYKQSLEKQKAKIKLDRFLVSKNTKKYFDYLESFL